jgi:6-phosphogluconolactonase
VLAGGRTPEAAYRLLVGADTDWSRWEIYFGDERCLPVDDAERNSRMAARALLDTVAIPAANVHSIPAEHPAGQLVHAVHNAPKPPPDRVSLGAAALSESRELLILATGAAKRTAIKAWQAGEPLPIAAIGGPACVDVLLDSAAQA